MAAFPVPGVSQPVAACLVPGVSQPVASFLVRGAFPSQGECWPAADLALTVDVPPKANRCWDERDDWRSVVKDEQPVDLARGVLRDERRHHLVRHHHHLVRHRLLHHRRHHGHERSGRLWER